MNDTRSEFIINTVAAFLAEYDDPYKSIVALEQVAIGVIAHTAKTGREEAATEVVCNDIRKAMKEYLGYRAKLRAKSNGEAKSNDHTQPDIRAKPEHLQ